MTVLKNYDSLILTAVGDAEHISTTAGLLLTAFSRQRNMTSDDLIQSGDLRSIIRAAEHLAEQIRQVYDREHPRNIRERYFLVNDDGNFGEVNKDTYQSSLMLEEAPDDNDTYDRLMHA